MTPKQLTEKAVADLFAARETLNAALEKHEAGSTGQLDALQRAQAFMDAAHNKLVVLEWERTRGGAQA